MEASNQHFWLDGSYQKSLKILGGFSFRNQKIRGFLNCDTSVLQLCDINMETNGALSQIFKHCVAKTTS